MILPAPSLTRRQRGGNPSSHAVEFGTRRSIKEHFPDDIPRERRNLQAVRGNGYVELFEKYI